MQNVIITKYSSHLPFKLSYYWLVFDKILKIVTNFQRVTSQMGPTFLQMKESDDVFFNRNWAEAYWDHWTGTGTTVEPIRWLWMRCFPVKTNNKKGIDGGSPVVTPMPKLVLFCGEKRSTV